MKPYENIVNLSFDHEHSNSDIGDLYLNQSIKKLNTKKWRVKSSQFRHDPSPIQTTGVFSQVLDLSNYQSTKKMVGIVNKSNSDVANTKTFRQYSKVDLSNINVSQMNLNDSLTNLELNETTETDENLLVNSMVKKAFDVVYAEERCCNSMTNSKCNTQLDNKFNMTTPKETGNVTINEENKILFNDPSFTAEFVTMMENRLELDERSFCELKEGEHIYDNCIKIVRYIAEGAQAKIYVGLIEEIEKYVAIKRFNISYDEMQVNKICSECDMIKNLDHPNVVKYFDVEIIKTDPDQCRIDIIMEYIEGQNLKDFIYESNKNNKGIDMLLVKQIAQKILEGLKYLHENKIIHRDLKVNEDI